MPTNYALLRKYGISRGDYELLLVEQSYCCAICGKEFDMKNYTGANYPQVDHNHKTGNVRGLLCRKCNLLLSKIKDNYEWAQSATNYLVGEFEYQKPYRKYDGFD